MTSPATESVTSIGELLGALKGWFDSEEVVWYRGHANAAWKLEPSLARLNALASEKALLAQFRRDAVPMLSKAQILGSLNDDWDWMFLMQHYGVPTRLLDWSESPLTALWFALSDRTNSSTPATDDSVLWALLPQELNSLRLLFPANKWDIPLCNYDPSTEEYTTNGLEDGSAARVLTPLAVIAERRFDRVVAQQGVFTVIHRTSTPLEDLGTGGHLRRIVVPAAAKDSLLAELTVLGIHELSLFPDLSRLGARVARRLS